MTSFYQPSAAREIPDYLLKSKTGFRPTMDYEVLSNNGIFLVNEPSSPNPDEDLYTLGTQSFSPHVNGYSYDKSYAVVERSLSTAKALKSSSLKETFRNDIGAQADISGLGALGLATAAYMGAQAPQVGQDALSVATILLGNLQTKLDNVDGCASVSDIFALGY